MKIKLLLFLASPFLISLLPFDDKIALSDQNSASVDTKILDANSIRTYFRNNGSFNRNPTTGNAGFEWPKSQSKFAVYASGLWIGARVGNDTLVTTCSYTYEYLPGYTDNNGNPQGSDDPTYRIYKLTRGINDPERLAWPNALLGNSDQGAPVYFDSLSGTLKVADFGDQTLYYLYTDSYPASHTSTNGGTLPLKADVRQLNFSIDMNFSPMDNIIFTQFIIINRSSNVWNDAYFSFWNDDDLGESMDDKLGCDSSLKLGYTYNATNSDGIYGFSPPAVGTILLKGVLKYTGNSSDVVSYCSNNLRINKTGYKDLGMTAFNATGISNNFRSSYRLMSGFTGSGAQITNPVGGFVTKLYYTGDPVTNTGWNTPAPGDQRFILSSGPVDVAPGDTQVVTYAQVIARGTSNLNSITLLRSYALAAKEFYNDCFNYDPVGISENNETINTFSLSQNYPNPFNPVTNFEFGIPEFGFVTLKVFDLLGKEVSTLVSKKLSTGIYNIEFDASSLPSGVYYYQLTAEGNKGIFSDTKRMVLLK